METRADYVLIGAFTISVLVGIFVFILWLSQQDRREFVSYDVIFESAVSGLSKGSEVRFSGIKVGEVEELSIDRMNPSNVIARVRVDRNTPVTEETRATLELQGLTGVGYIQFAGGGPESERLAAKGDEEVPTIVADPSLFQELFAGAPDIVTGANRVLGRLQEVLSDENLIVIKGILADVKSVSGAVAEREETIGGIIDNAGTVAADLSQSTDEIAQLTEDLAALSRTANDLIQTDGKALVEESLGTVRSVRLLSDNVNNLVETSTPGIRDFADGGLGQLALFLVETRETVRTLDRVLGRLESHPAQYISGNYATEYEAQ